MENLNEYCQHENVIRGMIKGDPCDLCLLCGKVIRYERSLVDILFDHYLALREYFCNARSEFSRFLDQLECSHERVIGDNYREICLLCSKMISKSGS
jgi:hypothetical protein